MFLNFFRFLRKVAFGQYDEMGWEDLVHMLILLGIIMGLLYAVL